MLRFFKKTNELYYLLVAIGVLFCGLGYINLNGEPLFPFGYKQDDAYLAFISLIGWIFLSAWICNSYANKIMGSINRILVEECNPIVYLNALKKSARDSYKGRSSAFMQLTLSTGLIEAGKAEEAIELLRSVREFSKGKQGDDEKICFYNNLASGYLDIGELTKVGKALEKMKGILGSSYLSGSRLEMYNRLYDHKLIMLNMENGDFQNAEPAFTQMYDNAKTKLEKVTAKFILGKIHLHYGRIEEAKNAFCYVVDNGNTLYLVDKAKGHLSRIGHELS